MSDHHYHRIIKKTLKKQLIIFPLSCWGGIAFLFAFLYELLEDNEITLWEWLNTTLQFILVFSDVIWFLPAMFCASFLGVFDHLYECEIIVYPKTIFSWILPIFLWFLIFNLCFFLIGVLKRTIRSRQKTKSI